jgi:hypothetical protein
MNAQGRSCSASASRTAFSVTSTALTALRRMRPAICDGVGRPRRGGGGLGLGPGLGGCGRPGGDGGCGGHQASASGHHGGPPGGSDVWSASVNGVHCEPEGASRASRAKAATMTSTPTFKRADVLLVETGLFDSRAKARAAIEAGFDHRRRQGGEEAFRGTRAAPSSWKAVRPIPWVGRGALKLAHALDLWPIEAAGKIALDVGASTGGFTEVLLSKAARPRSTPAMSAVTS